MMSSCHGEMGEGDTRFVMLRSSTVCVMNHSAFIPHAFESEITGGHRSMKCTERETKCNNKGTDGRPNGGRGDSFQVPVALGESASRRARSACPDVNLREPRPRVTS